MSGSVHFALGEARLRTFRHALGALSKIGTDLLVEALPRQLVLRSVEASHSAILTVSFDDAFFDAYDVYGSDVIQASASLKGIVGMLKTQRVSLMVFNLNATEGTLVVSLTCENGLKRTFSMRCLSTEVLRPTADKHSWSALLVVEASIFSRLLSTFDSGIQEVTLEAPPEQLHGDTAVKICSFVDPKKEDRTNDLVTRISIDPLKSFRLYSNRSGEVSTATFNIRDFRAMLSLCESAHSCLSIYLNGTGRPVIVEPCSDDASAWEGEFEAELLLATMMPVQDQAGYAPEEAPAERREDRSPLPRPEAPRAFADDAPIVGTPPEEGSQWSLGQPGVLAWDG